MLQRKLQKSSHHTQTHPSQRRKQSTQKVTRSDDRPSGLSPDRPATRSDCHPIGVPSDPLTHRTVLRIAYRYAIVLIRLTLLSNAPFNPLIVVSILDPYLLTHFWVLHTFLILNHIEHTTQYFIANRYRMLDVT